MPQVPLSFRLRIAEFLEKKNFIEQAFVLTPEDDHKFKLALRLRRLSEAKQIATKLQLAGSWNLLGEQAVKFGNFPLAIECFFNSSDFTTLLLIAT